MTMTSKTYPTLADALQAIIDEMQYISGEAYLYLEDGEIINADISVDTPYYIIKVDGGYAYTPDECDDAMEMYCEDKALMPYINRCVEDEGYTDGEVIISLDDATCDYMDGEDMADMLYIYDKRTNTELSFYSVIVDR